MVVHEKVKWRSCGDLMEMLSGKTFEKLFFHKTLSGH